MSKPLILISTLALLLSLSFSSLATNISPDQVAVQKMIDSANNAEMHKDIKSWTRIMKANCVPYFKMTIADNPPITLEQTIDAERTFLSTMDRIVLNKAVIYSFIEQGNNASVSANSDQIAYVKDDTGELGAAGLTHKFDVKTHLSFSLIKINGAWKMQTLTATTKTIAIDGRVKSVN